MGLKVPRVCLFSPGNSYPEKRRLIAAFDLAYLEILAEQPLVCPARLFKKSNNQGQPTYSVLRIYSNSSDRACSSRISVLIFDTRSGTPDLNA